MWVQPGLCLSCPIAKLKPKWSQGSLTDALLERISEDLTALEDLELKGCKGVTHEGIVKGLQHNKNGIKRLSIPFLSHSFVRCYLSLPDGI